MDSSEIDATDGGRQHYPQVPICAGQVLVRTMR